MEKITHCINHNRFIPIDTEELSALELIGKGTEKTNELVDKSNEHEERITNNEKKKVSFDDMKEKFKFDNNFSDIDYRGKWFGLSEPTLSDEGMRAQVQKNRDDIAKHSEQLEDIVYVTKYKTSDNTWNDAIINAITQNKSGNLLFPKALKIDILNDIVVTPSNNNLNIDLNGCILNYIGSGNCFTLQSNLWSEWKVDTKISIKNGIIIGNNNGKCGIEMVDSYGYKLSDILIKNFSFGTGFKITTRDDLNHWAEENIIENCQTISCLVGFHTSMSKSNLGTHSMNHTVIKNCKSNLKLDNSIGFLLEGNHARSIFESCGGWVQEDGAINTCMFKLNGWFENSILINPWVDGQTSWTHLNCIQLMDGYVQGGGTGDKQQQITITNLGDTPYFKVSDDLFKFVNIQSYNRKYGKVNVKMLSESEYFTNSTYQIGTVYRKVLMNSTNGDINKLQINFFGTKFSKILNVSVQGEPRYTTADDDYNKIGTLGYSKQLVNANKEITGVEIWRKSGFPHGECYVYVKVEGLLVNM